MNLPLKTTLSILAFLLALVIYIITCAPGLMFTDSGELAAVCSTLGIAHPTGYPLFTILGHLWTKIPLPFRDIYKLNLFSGFVTAVSVFVFFHINYLLIGFFNNKEKRKTKKLNEKNISLLSLIISLIFAFAATVWEQGTELEVYGLQIMLFNLILYFFLRGVLNGSSKNLMLAAFIFGLGMSNHLSTIWLLPAIIYAYIYRPGNKNTKNFDFIFFLYMTAAVILGVSLYIYLPLRSAGVPDFDWGGVSRSLDKFLYHTMGKQYQVWMFSNSKTWGGNAGKFFASFPYQLGWIGLLPLIAGLYFLAVKAGRLLVFFMLIILVYFIYNLNYSIHDIEIYFLPVYAVSIIIAGMGLFFLAKGRINFIYAFIIIPLASLIINFNDDDESENYSVPEYTRILTENLDKNAVIISAQWDYWCSAFWYMQQVEGYRPDITLVEKELTRRTWFPPQMFRWYPKVCEPCRGELEAYMSDLSRFEAGLDYNPASIQRNYIGYINCIIDKNYSSRPVYVTLDVLQTDPDIARDYNKMPQGFAFRLYKDSLPELPKVESIDISKLKSSLNKTDNYLAVSMKAAVATNLVNIGLFYNSIGRADKAKLAFLKALEIDPENNIAKQAIMKIR